MDTDLFGANMKALAEGFRELGRAISMRRNAMVSRCGRYRWTLVRRWSTVYPVLLVVMFNPSTADAVRDDATIRSLVRRADRWGFGGIVVVNLIPLRCSRPGPAIEAVSDPLEHEALQRNLQEICAQVLEARAILLAYGALGDRVPAWTSRVLDEIRAINVREVPIYCMGRTASGAPIHPLARGKHRVPDDAPLVPWP